ncbi:protein NLRC3 isoform X2 [Mugil cephalus]|uniref:protein NLRC3 isoform X2 n=1 Tax=Mugil cephalus TaxID=48193 RepID=UPI001FB6108B|nr:protein NLRC3 isoform X2 [Mugil cephalus]
MDPDREVERNGSDGDEEEREKWERPPSSYGSMKSDIEEEEEEEEEEEIEEMGAVLPESTVNQAAGFQLNRSESPETLYTLNTQQTKPQGAVVIDTRSSDLGDVPEDYDEEDEDDILITNSPEPPEPVELDCTMQTDEYSQPGRLHPEQDLPHIFKSIQNALTTLTVEELFQFKMLFCNWEKRITLQQLLEGDILDFVDRILETLGQHRSLFHTIHTLESMNKKEEAEKLHNQCRRAMIRFHLQEHLTRKHQVIHEGVVRAGRQSVLNTIYVQPQISTCGYGGVDPSHELRSVPYSPPLQVPSPDTFVDLNNLFRLQKDDGTPVKKVLTTGIPGIGMSVSVAKFSLDWAEMHTNRDLQFVIKLSFRSFWRLRSRSMSIMEVIKYYYPECKDMKYLDEEDCKFLIIMDSFDCYQVPLDWKNAPVITDNYTQAHPDVLIVNIIRGTVLRGARVWILGRRAAVSQIPSQFIDVVTEIQGFSDEMKDDFLTRRFSQNQNPELAANIVAHYKKLPTLHLLAQQPFVCWMVATVFERCYLYQGYGVHPPRLTPFYINILIVQINRRLKFYHDMEDNGLKWSSEDKKLVTEMAKMAFKMLENNTSVFFEEDVKEAGLNLTEVTVQSGMCTELPTLPGGRRKFCFIHFTFQEFMAALYVFIMFRTESKNVLDTGSFSKILRMKSYHSKSAAGLVNSAWARTSSAQKGHFDMFLRFLCGLLSPDCYHSQLGGYLFPHNAPKVGGLDEVQQLLQQTIQSAPEDRRGNLNECLREMTQEDE